MTKNEGKFNWAALIVGILLLITGLCAFANPTASLIGVVFIFGFMGLVRGIFHIYAYTKLKKLNIKGGMLILVGIIDILLSIFILINWQVSLLAFPMVFAIWFLADSIADLFSLPMVRKMSKSLFWLKLIVNILAIIVGILLIFNPASAAITIAFLIGFFFTIKGIEFIVAAFSSI